MTSEDDMSAALGSEVAPAARNIPRLTAGNSLRMRFMVLPSEHLVARSRMP